MRAHVRELRAEDLDALVGLVARCNEGIRDWAPAGWQPPDPESERPGWRPKRGVRSQLRYVACDTHGAVVAAVTAWLEPATHQGHVGRLFVEPRMQGRGLGSRLLGRVERELVAAGATTLTLDAPEGSPAESFYAARGWTAARRAEPHERLDLPMVRYTKPVRPERGAS